MIQQSFSRPQKSALSLPSGVPDEEWTWDSEKPIAAERDGCPRDARLRKVFNVLPGGVIILDGAGQIRECNPAAVKLLGEPLQGALWREVAARVFSPRPDDGHNLSLCDGRRVNVSTQALEGEPGQILLITDVTETRRLHEQLSRQKRLSAQGDMAAALAHQIRTPLSSAILYLSSLCCTGFNESLWRAFTVKALGRLKDLEKLVEEMLLFARGGGIDGTSFLVEDLVHGLIEEQVLYAQAAGFEIQMENRAPGLRIQANSHALKSAFHNLINNSIEACGHGGRLVIVSEKSVSGWIELRFTDNGPGIPEELRQRIFDPFVTMRSNGTGLGLAVAHAVIAAHGGTITLESVAPEGACFLIRLPALRENT